MTTSLSLLLRHECQTAITKLQDEFRELRQPTVPIVKTSTSIEQTQGVFVKIWFPSSVLAENLSAKVIMIYLAD